MKRQLRHLRLKRLSVLSRLLGSAVRVRVVAQKGEVYFASGLCL